MSIGYRTVKYDYDTAKEIRTINELRLYEVSLVTRAANEEATIKSEDDNNTCTWVVTATDDEKVMFYNGAETKAETKFDFSKLKDGGIYGRKNGVWALVENSGGSTNAVKTVNNTAPDVNGNVNVTIPTPTPQVIS